MITFLFFEQVCDPSDEAYSERSCAWNLDQAAGGGTRTKGQLCARGEILKALVITSFNPLQWISTHFGRAGSETSWELGNYVPEFAVSLLLEPIKLRALK